MNMLEFDKNKVVGTITINKNVSETDIENIIVSSFEGGSNYWMGLDNTGEEWEQKPKGEPLSTWATNLLLEGKSIKLYDIHEEEDDSNWILTLDKLIKGIELNSINRPWDADLENGDASTADCIVQFALFGKVVYS
jgi:hypothetical protein